MIGMKFRKCHVCHKFLIQDYLKLLKVKKVTAPKEAFCLCQHNGLIDIEGRVVEDELQEILSKRE